MKKEIFTNGSALGTTTREFIYHYLPLIRKVSDHTFSSYRDGLNSYITYLEQEKEIRQKNICFAHLSKDNVKGYQDWPLYGKNGNQRPVISDRNDAITRGEGSFSETYVNEFYRKVDEYLANEADSDNCGASFEQILLKRIAKYHINYFLWVEDFSLPTTNNLSEQRLRGIKSHMKI